MLQKLEIEPVKGYKLIDVGSFWEFHSAKGIYRGNFKQVCTFAVVQFGFSLDEFEIAVQEMERHFQNGAEFGVHKTFMFTFDKVVARDLH
jgi:hypothetical protein